MVTKDTWLKFMQNKVLNRIVTWFILPVCIVALAYLLVDSISQPVNFNKEKAAREKVGIERLKDIRTLQNAYKSVYGKYTDNFDSLKTFYTSGDVIVKLQIGSKDDSAAVAHTKAIRKTVPWLRGADLNKYYKQRYDNGDKELVFSVDQKIPVRDTLFKNRASFRIDSLRTIPFSGGRPIEMESVIKTVSGVKVPLFEARMPYRYLLYGMDNQLRINLDSECRNSNRYEGLQVGSVSAPNNNAGNWE
ncbi:MAG TPA: hypothetical protein DHU75_01230 [Rikenellaceae bacterium]|nr:hypothetical protein [Rikenellaceae bacterium]